jgi:F-type H+-transporting ATPase subunit a
VNALDIETIFTLNISGFSIPITETVIISWFVMLILITASFLLTRRLREVPSGPQVFLELAVDFLNKFAKDYFGPFSKFLGPYLGSLFLFLLLSNIIGVISPVEFSMFGLEIIPPFKIRPPTKDINVTAAFGVISITLVIICGLLARGVLGWLKRFLYPLPFMLPFNIMDYGTRLISLSLRLFGNILGAFVLMSMIEGLLPVALPAVLSLYFDFFDGIIQAAIFVFLTTIYISEAVKLNEE